VKFGAWVCLSADVTESITLFPGLAWQVKILKINGFSSRRDKNLI
jgi:hypothetical protein